MLNGLAKALITAAIGTALLSPAAIAAPLTPSRGEIAVESAATKVHHRRHYRHHRRGAVVVAPFAYVDSGRRYYYDDYYYRRGVYVRAPFVRIWVPH